MEWRLSFIGSESLTWTCGVLVAVTAGLAMFWMLRRYEANLVPRSVSVALLSLRTMVLLLLLLTLMQPVLTRAWKVEQQEHRLVVAFDVSESMDTADRHASPAEMLRWAQALGMLGNESTNGLLEEWIAAYDSGDQPDWGGAGGDSASDAEIAAIRKRHVAGVYAEFATMSRIEFVRRLLLTQSSNLLTKLADHQEVYLRLFGVENRVVEVSQLADVVSSDRIEFQPSGTDAIGVLNTAISEESSDRITGVVLFSDGRQTIETDVASEAARFGSLRIPVYCVPIGSQRSPRDLSVASVSGPQNVFLNDTASIRATVTSVGFAGNEVTVNLERDGVAIDQRTVTVGADYFEVEFDVPADAVGNYDYTIRTDVEDGELRDDNNAREFSVSVVDKRAHVILLDGDARWEFRYLNSALNRDTRVSLSTVLFQQPSLELLNRTFLDSRLPDLDDFARRLAKTDLLIVGDIAPLRISEAVWEAIEQAVSDDGLTLMIVPGRRYMPHEYTSGTLERLLPITNPQERHAGDFRPFVPGGALAMFRLATTPAARGLTLFKFSDAAAVEQVGLDTLPGHPWACTAKAKPVASVWAHLSVADEELRNMSVVVHQHYGFGQVLWMGIDSTWRWRFRAGDKWHHRFWGQVVRWAARNKSADGNDQVRMTLSEAVIQDTESVDVSVRWEPELLQQLKGGSVQVIVRRVEGATEEYPEQSFELSQQKGAPERFSTTITSLLPGEYTVQLGLKNTELELDQDVLSDLLVRRQLSNELANVSCNRDFLQQVAALSGGRILEPWQLSELPELVRPEQLVSNTVQEKSLWDHWATMVLFFMLLTGEWVLRKVNGLP